MYRQLENYRVPPEFETLPTEAYACPVGQQGENAQPLSCPQERLMPKAAARKTPPVQVPRLLKTYLAIGARIAAPPAWDREFRTIDFLTLLERDPTHSPARASTFEPS